MPKDGSSRRKRRARELAKRDGISYTEALRRSDPRTRADHPDETVPPQPGQTVLDVVHTALQQVTATDPTDIPAVLRTAYEGLDLTCAADRLLEETLLEIDIARFWPGSNGIGRDARHKLEVALNWLWAAPSLPPMTFQHDQVTMLAPMDLAVELYPGTLSEPVAHHELVDLVLIQARIVALAITALWDHTAGLLRRAAANTRDQDDARACRVAAAMATELARPESINRIRTLDRRILLAANREHTREQLLADQTLMLLLHTAAAATMRPNGWSMMTEVTAACVKADREWACERWGFKADIALVNATGQFRIRRVPRKGRSVIEIRPRTVRAGSAHRTP